jgi:hypothetical protein
LCPDNCIGIADSGRPHPNPNARLTVSPVVDVAVMWLCFGESFWRNISSLGTSFLLRSSDFGAVTMGTTGILQTLFWLGTILSLQ